jgi:glutamine phosphoribosylpyrophosphate amidotransferase
MIEAAGGNKESLCRACFDGEYPVAVPEETGKFILEDAPRVGAS